MKKTVLLTGGSRGIGKATVLRLLARGFSVAFTYKSSRDAADLVVFEAAARQAGAEAPDVASYESDIRDAAGSASLVEQVLKRFGHIDCLVNNAGIRSDALMYNMTAEQWHDVLETNLTGAFAMIQAVLPGMLRQRGGAIVNVASLSGLHGVAGQANYSAAKGGLIAMTRSLAREVARSGVRVNCVAPGLVDTEMISGMPAEARKEMIRSIPMRRTVKVEEVAAAIEFLLSDDASGITGQVLNIDGGTSA